MEYPEEMVELSGLVELPVIELTGADCKCLKGGRDGGLVWPLHVKSTINNVL